MGETRETGSCKEHMRDHGQGLGRWLLLKVLSPEAVVPSPQLRPFESPTMLGRLSLFTALATFLPNVAAQSCPTIDPAQAPTFASGYSGRVVVNGLKQPRGIIFDNQGNILTSERGGYGVRYITLTDNGGTDVCVKTSKQLIQDSSLNHGIALSPDGKTLFASSVAAVYSWTYDGTTGTVSDRGKLLVHILGYALV